MLSKTDEFKRAWTVVLASALGAGTGVSALTFYSLGAFVEPLSQEFGWTRAQVTAAPLFMTMSSLLMGPIVGWLSDRHGARPVAITSQVFFVIAVACLSFVTANIATLYVGFFLIALVGAGTMPITWTRAITGWFFSARGMALGFALMGTGLMGMVAPALATYLIGAYGWRMAYVGLAMVPLIVALPLAIAFFRDPSEHVQSTTTPAGANAWGYSLPQAIRTMRFWQMALGLFLAAAGIGGVLVHAFPFLTDRGIDRGTAAAVAGLLGLAVTVGRIGTGFLLDRFHGPYVAFVMLVMPTLACGLLLISADNILLCAIGIMFVGLAGGAEFDIAAYFVSRYFGRKHYGAVYGLLYTIFVIGSAVTPPIAGKVYDTFKTYDPALYGGIVLFFVAAILSGTLGKYPDESKGG
ncbi:MAG: MFS transporter [Rhodospirillaceae bacterium]|nr:MFS transporter [Rhodospirillaceae bacterium]